MRKNKVIALALALLMMSTIGCAGGNADSASGNQTVTASSSAAPSTSEPAAPTFPDKDMTFWIGTSTGGANDLNARALIPGMEEVLGVRIIPELLQGANGAIAAVKLQALDPNGLNLYLHSQSLLMMQYTGQSDVNIAKLQPVAQVSEDFSAVCVPANAPYDTLEEFIEYCRQNPGKVKAGNSGNGSIWHIASVLFANAFELDIKMIPYDQGGSQQTVACAAGEVDVIFNSPSEQQSLVDAGSLKQLAVLSDNRHPTIPDVPTVKEVTGVDLTFPVWRGVFTTAGVSADKLQILSDAIEYAMTTDVLVQFMESSGTLPKFKDIKEFSEFVKNEDEVYKNVLDELGLKVSEPKA